MPAVRETWGYQARPELTLLRFVLPFRTCPFPGADNPVRHAVTTRISHAYGTLYMFSSNHTFKATVS